ncbi:M14 family metallopeptidase [Aquibacillus kalidii]|uniref:M14 family metallopeptidase n=1 Tax=Aquibacillus kalidii TaxID=2762597 RepID=UPI0016493691|nr:M14 family metallocarboxypeptidase [Aquibacillus kalidii]
MQIVAPKQLYSYAKMIEDICNLEKQYSSVLSTKKIGESVEGKKIVAIKLGHGETEIFINAAHHAREWLTTSLVMHMVDTYCQGYANDDLIGIFPVRDILSKTSIWFVPMVNPDGVSLVQYGVEGIENCTDVIALNNNQKSFSSWKANINGVDLNRQYPAGWETIDDQIGKPAPSMYKGPSPLSEPETKAIYDFTLEHDFKTAVSYHSSGEEIFWKYKSSGALLNRSKKIATMIKEKTGYQLIYPSPNPSGGGFTDWFLDSLGKPAFTLEISPLVGPRPVPLENYDKIWNDNKELGLMLALEAFLNKDNR